MKPAHKVLLCILDGWGIRPASDDNAITLAGTPHLDKLTNDMPHTELQTSGLAVGAPRGADGQLRGGPHQHRRRPHRLPGPGAHQPGLSSPASSPPIPSSAPRSTRPRRTASPSTCSGWCLPAACTRRWTTSTACLEAAHAARACPTSTSTPSPMGATPHPRAGSATWRSWRSSSARRTPGRSPPWAGATTAWTATSDGTGCSSPTRPSSTARAPRPPMRSPPSAPRTRRR